jgi:hypothetical protein
MTVAVAEVIQYNELGIREGFRLLNEMNFIINLKIKIMNIRVTDYLRNKQQCSCGCKSFLSYSDASNTVTLKLVCKDCDSIYLRDLNEINGEFILQYE